MTQLASNPPSLGSSRTTRTAGDVPRVHVVPPLDGIYAQWDHAAGAVTEYYNPFVPDGAPVDGRNDETFGNSRVHVGPGG